MQFPHSIPYLTKDLQGVGGNIRVNPEDFRVEEMPLYEPSGEGTHLYVRFTKKGRSTNDVVSKFARLLEIDRKSIGVPGLKDANAVTSQTISIPGICEEDLESIQIDGVEILWARLHTNKLKTGHLAGNRFTILIRDAEADPARVEAVADRLRQLGCPNGFGPQRFGAECKNHLIGRELILGDPDEKYGRLSREAARFNIHAFQSELFNRCLARRIEAGQFGSIVEGDWAMKHENGACFHVEDAPAELDRAVRLEISATGPMLGYRMSAATGEPGRMEQEIFGDVDPEAFRRTARGLTFRGERRSYRIPVPDLEVDACTEGIRCKFSLPRGSFGTSVIREIMKLH